MKMNYIKPRRASKPLPVADSSTSRRTKPSMAKRPFQSSAWGVNPKIKELRLSEFSLFMTRTQSSLCFLMYLYQTQNGTCTKGQTNRNSCKKRARSNRNKTGLGLNNQGNRLEHKISSMARLYGKKKSCVLILDLRTLETTKCSPVKPATML
jgi:hypothetical protein